MLIDMLARKIKTGVAGHEAGTHVACDAEKKWALVGGSYGLAAFDIKDPTAPRKMAFVKTGVATYQGGCFVLIKGEMAFVCGGYGLAVIDRHDLIEDRHPRLGHEALVGGHHIARADEHVVLDQPVLGEQHVAVGLARRLVLGHCGEEQFRVVGLVEVDLPYLGGAF